MNGGRFDFDDGGTYCGGWEEGKAHGHGVCTGPKGQGEYAGAWHYGFEVSGVYLWPSGNTYSGQWQNGKRHGLGVEQRGRWLYRGEWSQGYKGRYGVRQSANSNAKYEGTWSSGLQDGYGQETYADGGIYQGQWLRGMRHGYGVRKSAPYGVAAKFRSRSHAHASLTSLRSEGAPAGDVVSNEPIQPPPSGSALKKQRGDGAAVGGGESRGGFVLRANSEPPARRRRSLSERTLHMKQTILSGLRIKKQKSTGDIHARVAAGSVRSSGSTMSCTSDESGYDRHGSDDHVLPPEEHVPADCVEAYMGEWKNDKRSGFGVSERSDGLKYEGEWFNNKKFGYGVTHLKDGTREEGKYKNNVLVTSPRKKHLLFVRSSKLRERIDAAVAAANRAAQIAAQKADIAMSRMSTSRDRADQADMSSDQARGDSDLARIHAKQFDPTFVQPGTEIMRRQRYEMTNHAGAAVVTPTAAMPVSHDYAAMPSAASMQLQQQQMGGGGMRTMSPTGGHYDMVTPPMATPPGYDMNPASTAAGVTWRSPESPSITVPTSMISVQQQQQQQQQQQMYGEDVYGGGARQQPYGLQGSASQQAVAQRYSQTNQQAMQLQQSPSAHAVMPNRPDSLIDSAPGPSTSGYQPSMQMGAQYGASGAGPSTSEMTTSPSHVPQVRYAAEVETHRYPADQLSTPSSPMGRTSPTPSAASTQTNQWNDHFDQYARAANPVGGPHRAPPHGTPPGQGPAAAAASRPTGSPGAAPPGSTAASVVRRSTLAGQRDLAAGAPKLTLDDSAARPSTSAMRAAAPGPVAVGAAPLLPGSPGKGGSANMGSIPDLHALDKQPVVLSREDVARMSSQRRQEVQRLRDEEELLRANPLRYLFHPAVRAFVIRWKLPLLVVLVNVCLSIMFYQLLTYEDEDNGDD